MTTKAKAPKPPTATDVAKAAQAWCDAKRAIALHEPVLKASAEVLKAHFRSKKTRDFKGLVGYACIPTSGLDADKVRAELGARVKDFLKAGTRETLSLLKP